ncbi:MAG: hypothetical protein Q7R92_01845 [bacterium]|nr:hypothetical protein [bacterium]
MSKLIRLKLVKIKYTGDSIGDDIRVEIECLNFWLGLNKTITKGSVASLNAEVGQFFADQDPYYLSMSIKVIERDLIFNDFGSKQVKIKIDLRNNLAQTSIHEIIVSERRGSAPGKSTATFYVTIEAQVKEAIGFIPDTKDGWLVGHRDDIKEDASLPTYLKVRLDRVESKREYLTVLEGPLQGVHLWVSLNNQGKSYLLLDSSQTGPVFLTYSISKKTLRLKNKTYSTTDDPESPWKVGVYDIEIPDWPHPGGRNYPNVKYAKVWFRIGHSGARYLHTGRFSAGCITIVEQAKWDDLCVILMKARKGDGKSVGALEVTE